MGLLPDEVVKDTDVENALQNNKDYEKFCLIYFMVSMTQHEIGKSFDFLQIVDFNFNSYEEFSSKKDLSYYTVLILATCGDYDVFKTQLARKSIKKVALFSENGRKFVNSVIKNDFKTAQFIILAILEELKYDPIMAENLSNFRRLIDTSFTKMFLKAYTRVKISAVSDCLLMNQSECKQFLESEIKRGRIDFKIDED